MWIGWESDWEDDPERERDAAPLHSTRAIFMSLSCSIPVGGLKLQVFHQQTFYTMWMWMHLICAHNWTATCNPTTSCKLRLESAVWLEVAIQLFPFPISIWIAIQTVAKVQELQQQQKLKRASFTCISSSSSSTLCCRLLLNKKMEIEMEMNILMCSVVR